jgi:hypothetical protein
MKERQVKGKSRACGSFSLTKGDKYKLWRLVPKRTDKRRLFTKNSSWQPKQPTVHTTVTFYGDYIKMCEDFPLNTGDKRTERCIMTMHHLTINFYYEIFYQNNMAVIPHPTYSPALTPCDFPVSLIEHTAISTQAR